MADIEIQERLRLQVYESSCHLRDALLGGIGPGYQFEAQTTAAYWSGLT